MTRAIPTHTLILPMTLAFAMAFAPLAFAQETPAPVTETTPAAPADAAAPENLSMGSELGADGVGKPYVAATFEVWEQRCVRTEDGADPCQLYQLLKDAQGNAVAEFSMFNLTDAGQAVAGATIIVPLETLLTENLVMSIDSAKAKVYPFTFCSTIGCVARVGFTAAEVEQFKKGAKGVLTIVPVVAPEEKVTVELSLKGFTAGFAAVSATNR